MGNLGSIACTTRRGLLSRVNNDKAGAESGTVSVTKEDTSEEEATPRRQDGGEQKGGISNFLTSLIGSIMPEFSGEGGEVQEQSEATLSPRVYDGYATVSKAAKRQDEFGAPAAALDSLDALLFGSDNGDVNKRPPNRRMDTYAETSKGGHRPDVAAFCDEAEERLRSAGRSEEDRFELYKRLWHLAERHRLPVRPRAAVGSPGRQMAALLTKLCSGDGAAGEKSGAIAPTAAARDGIGGLIPSAESNSLVRPYRPGGPRGGQRPPPVELITLRPDNPLKLAQNLNLNPRAAGAAGSASPSFVVSGGFSFDGAKEENEKNSAVSAILRACRAARGNSIMVPTL